MAALEAATQATATVSFAEEADVVRRTSPNVSRTQGRRNIPVTPRAPQDNLTLTVPNVDPLEKGSEEERNQATVIGADRKGSIVETQVEDNGAASRIRSELARDLVHRIEQLLPSVGDVSLATTLQLLRRDLSRCHDTLKGHPSEGNFLSVITLVESAMAQLKWKQYTRVQLDAMRWAFDLCYRRAQVRFEDYENVRGLLASMEVDATPRIDLETLKMEDVTNGEDE